jgi:hypothetical protein
MIKRRRRIPLLPGEATAGRWRVSSPAEAEALARAHAEVSPRRPLHIALFFWLLVVGFVARQFIAPKLLLVSHYGWSRVQWEGLWVVETWHKLPGRRAPGAGYWLISNGDRIRVERLEYALCWIGPTLAILAVTVPLLWLLWRRLTNRPTAAGGNG